MRAVVVVPTIRENCIRDFLSAWQEELRGVPICLIEDNPERTFRIEGSNIQHLSWQDIDATLGERSWIIPRRTDCVRSFGYFLAATDRPDMIVTLDDDCYPDPEAPGFLARHWNHLNGTAGDTAEAWVSSVGGVVPRGVPYFATQRTAPVILNHGLWKGVPDYDAATQLVCERRGGGIEIKQQTIPRGSYFPMCGMNLAWKPEATPGLYFLLMGRNYEYDRFGDIWAGVLFKKIADHLGYAVTSGDPTIIHQRASNPFANLRKEAPGLEINERFWQAVDAVRLTGTDVRACYEEIARGLELEGDYFAKLKEAMLAWADLFPGLSVARPEAPALVAAA